MRIWRRNLEYFPVAVGIVALIVLTCDVKHLMTRLSFAEAPLSDLLAFSGSPVTSQPHVLFVFRAGDCTEALNTIDVWNMVQSQRDAEVQGILVTSSADTAAMRAIIRSYHIGFPVRIVRPKPILEQLVSVSGGALPLSLVFDKELRIRAVIPAHNTMTDSSIRATFAFNASVLQGSE